LGKKKLNKKIKNTLVFLLLVILCGCGKSVEKISEQRFLFGTYINIVIYSNDKSQAKKSINLAFEKISDIDERYNSKNKNSAIYKINTSTNKIVNIDSEFQDILKKIKEVYEESDRKYDVTISPLLELWGFGQNDRTTVPTKQEIKKALEFVDFSNVIVENNHLKYLAKTKEMDTGSFLKGYAILKAKELLEKRGEKHVFITSISSITTIGTKIKNKPWRVGIQDPFDLSKTLGIVELSGKSLGVSGDYQTYIEINGKKYHHIMDNKTGYPIRDKKLVAVICSSSFLADMYSTALFLMPENKAFQLAKEKGLEVLIVKRDGTISKTENFILK